MVWTTPELGGGESGRQRNGTYALFIRVVVVCPQRRHSLTRYGSRENSAFSRLPLSVRISTETECGVARPQVEQSSVMSARVLPFVAIPLTQKREICVKGTDR